MSTDILGFAYSALVAGGGIMGENQIFRNKLSPSIINSYNYSMLGYVKAQSIPSLAAGLTFGALLAGGAYMNSSNPPKPLLQLTTAAILGSMMSFRFYNSGKFMPAGLMAGASILMFVRGIVTYNRYLPMIGSKME
jgi:uncharacterized membrane protein (UPF0136 family)